ncbi:MAG: metallophosphoesterase [Candidatus Eremiobacteraeota bacterium]|nr:metallophosphoesterase [Candidatus Eremiobacteraeota bacterium]
MRIGIIADTHDNILMIKRAVEVFNDEKVDLIMHAGDHIAPFTCIIWEQANCEILAIYGNNDGDHAFLKKKFRKIGRIYERPREFILDGKRILMLHEPDNLRDYAMSGKFDLIIFGHTHRRQIYHEGDTLVVNPGEACGWITGLCTAMIINLDSMKVEEFILGESPIGPIMPAIPEGS